MYKCWNNAGVGRSKGHTMEARRSPTMAPALAAPRVKESSSAFIRSDYVKLPFLWVTCKGGARAHYLLGCAEDCLRLCV